MANFDDISFTKMTYTEGAAPSTPTTGDWVVYAKTDGMYYKDDAGTETGPLGSGGGGSTLPGWLDNFIGTTDSNNIYWDGDDVSSLTTVTITGSQTITEADNLCSVAFSGQSSNDLNGLFLARSFSVGDRYQVPVKYFTRTASEAKIIGLAFTDGTTGAANVIANTLQFNGPLRVGRSGTLTNASTTSFLGFSGESGTLGYFFYLRLTYQAANTFRVESSIDGVTWQAYVSDIGVTMTPTHVGVVWTAQGTSDSGAVVTFGPMIKTA